MARDRTAHWSALLGAAKRGDERAYARFLREATPVIRGLVRARGANLGQAAWEDVVQEVLLAVHAKRHTWREAEPLEPWLYAIARYKVIDAQRRRRRGMDVPIEDHIDELIAPPEPDPTEASDMARVIDALDARSARIVRAVGLYGASVRETGERLGMSENAVRVALHRAMKRLATLRDKDDQMKTDDLIRVLSADTAVGPPVGRLLMPALMAGGLVAGALLLVAYGLRPDLGRALGDGQVLVKHLFGPLLGVAAAGAALRAARPGARIAGWARALLVAPVLVLLAFVADLVALPVPAWPDALTGQSILLCLSGVTLLSLPFFALALIALRRGAPTDPRIAGALAGLASGGFGAAVYALHCIEDSALFYGVWYSIAILAVTALGALLGPRLLRW